MRGACSLSPRPLPLTVDERSLDGYGLKLKYSLTSDILILLSI